MRYRRKPSKYDENPRALRLRLGLNQTEFWERVGVTQSGGSRYENGRAMPPPVRELVRIVYVEKIDLSKLRRGDVELLDYIKRFEPYLYKRLRAEVRT